MKFIITVLLSLFLYISAYSQEFVKIDLIDQSLSNVAINENTIIIQNTKKVPMIIVTETNEYYTDDEEVTLHIKEDEQNITIHYL